ncbi:Acyl-coenzyme A thioesterase 8, partial [Dichanthelium oligosanthes]
VTEFLGQVPLLQCLPGSSIRRIAEAVQVKRYEPGDYVAREGEPVDGLYIVLDGQAEVSAPANAEEANRPDYVLNKYDYFGYGTNSSDHQVNVVALSKLTCFILPNQYGHLLQPKTIWNAEETPEHSLLEQILHLEPLEVSVRQSLMLMAVFDLSSAVVPILYQVHRARDGSSFATRKVEAKQKGLVIFTLIASFQKEEVGFEHQAAIMPDVPPPEQARISLFPFLWPYRNLAAKKKFTPWPIEMRFCEDSASQHKPSSNYWFRARGKLSDDQALHRCVVAYASDLLYSGVSLNPHREKGLKTYSLSLDHSIWFHKPVKADDWLLYVIESPSAHGGRGFVTGRMFNRQGELIMSLTQEALIRREKTRGPNPRPKL